mgnify:CR=1 FL=1
MKQYCKTFDKFLTCGDGDITTSLIRLSDLADEAVENETFSDEFNRSCWEVAQRFSYSLLNFY